MQKKIIALAVAGLMSGAAFAQSNVTIYGIMDVGYLNGDAKYGDSAGNRADQDMQRTGFDSGALTTSRLGFRGTEDLGGGLKANFVHEMGIAANSNGAGTDTATSLTTRLSYVGLSGGFGSFDVGRQNAVVDDVWAIGSTGMRNNAVGGLYQTNVFVAGDLAALANAGGVDNSGAIRRTSARLSDAWTYRSPVMGGFKVAAQYGKTENDINVNGAKNTDAQFDIWGLTATYSAGPLNVGFAYGKETTKALAGTSPDNKQWTIGGNYNLGVATLFGIYTNGKNSAGANAVVNLSKSDGYEFGVHVPVTGVLTIAASYMDGKQDVGVNGVVNRGTADYRGYQLAGLYSLSKRTTAYAMYGDISAKWNEPNFNAKLDRDQFAVGLRHSF